MPIEGDVFAIAKVLRKGALVHQDTRTVGNMFKKALKAKLSMPGTGRIYTTNFYTDVAGRVRPIGERKPHQASAAGQPPAKDTGELQNSVDFNVARVPDGTELDIGVGAKHAELLEHGTSKMQPRPFFRSTIQEQLPEALRIWADGIAKRERAEARRLGGAG